jgi:hypothetical protein
MEKEAPPVDGFQVSVALVSGAPGTLQGHRQSSPGKQA